LEQQRPIPFAHQPHGSVMRLDGSATRYGWEV